MIEILNCSKVVLRSQQSYSSQLQLNRSRDVGMECLTFVLVQEPNEVFSSLGQSNHNGRGMGRISPVIKYSAALIYAINNAEKPLVFFKNVIVSHWNNLLSKLIGTAQSMSKCFCLCSSRNCFRGFYNNSCTARPYVRQLSFEPTNDSLVFILFASQ